MYIYNARTTVHLNRSHLLIYIKGIKYTEKKLCENNAKSRKKINKKWKNGAKLELNKVLVKLHLRKNEVVLGSLQPLVWRSLR